MTEIEVVTNNLLEKLRNNLNPKQKDNLRERFPTAFGSVADLFPVNHTDLDIVGSRLSAVINLLNLKHTSITKNDVKIMLARLKILKEKTEDILAADKGFILYSSGNLSRLKGSIEKDLPAIAELSETMKHAKKNKMEYDTRTRAAQIAVQLMTELMDSKRIMNKLSQMLLYEPTPDMFEKNKLDEKGSYRVTARRLSTLFFWTIGFDDMTTDKFGSWLKSGI